MSAYEQKLTITIMRDKAISLSVALSEYLRYSKQHGVDVDNAHPNSCVGNVKEILHNLDRVSLGDRSAEVSKMIEWEMVRKTA